MESPKAGLEPVRKVVQEALSACSDPAEVIRQARAGFLEKVAVRNNQAAQGRGPRRFAFRRWWLALAGVTAVSAVLAIGLWSYRPITFRVGGSGTAVRPGDLIEAPAARPVSVQFSEGSSFLLQGGGRARVLATEGRGARVLIDSGDMDVAIAHPGYRTGRWSFEAGPFHIQVTGTRFHVLWHPGNQLFALATKEGRVIVSGTCLATPQTVAAGENIELTCPSDVIGVRVTSVPPSKTAPSSPPSEESAAEVSPGLSPPSLAPKLFPWRERLAAGRLVEGLRMAEQAGFDRVCQEATLKELVALADGARLSGRSARAIAALRMIRSRFPHTADATTAAFTLGRIAFEQRDAYTEAVHWFSTYLAEQPSGPLMGDSVGRLMEARQRAGDLTGAREDAERYLRRFPAGPYASKARAILPK